MKPEVGFVVGLVSFSGTVGAKKKDKEGTEDWNLPSVPEDLSSCFLLII